MTIKRHIQTQLKDWQDKSKRKPLVVRGARQVGKTTLIREFGKSFGFFIELNLDKEEDRNLIDTSNSVQELMNALSLLNNIEKKDWKHLCLFIDEVQESPKAIQYLRYFYEELPEIHVIAAGSLFEHRLRSLKSFPVGRINYMYLFPINFQEYLEARGNSMLLDRSRQVPVDHVAHRLLLQEFHDYCIIGGMPEIVAQYVESKDITSLISVYESIWDTYKEDVEKYAQNHTETQVIKHIMNTASSMVDKRVKFQNFGHSNYRSREVGGAFTALDQAKIIQNIYPTTAVKFPVIPDHKKSPRLQFLDTGILNYDLGIQAELIPLTDLSDTYRGAIIPHLVTQELISLQTTSYRKPNFWVRDKTQSSAEVDLVLPYDEKIIPIEIKSGAAGKLRSLHQFMDRCDHHYAVRMYAGGFAVHEAKTQKGKKFYLMNLPYYLGTLIYEYIGYFVRKF